MNEKEQILLGTIIGDGCIFKDKRAKNYRMNLAHSLKQKKYFVFKYEIIKDVIKSDPKERKWTDKRTKKEYSEIRFQSRTSEYFTNLYNIFYKEGKKIIPKSEIYKIESLGLAIKYFDDGNYLRGAGNISMHDFDEESVKNFRMVLLEKFNINTTLQKRNNVYIPKKEFVKFKKLIIEHATSDVLYKLGELLET